MHAQPRQPDTINAPPSAARIPLAPVPGQRALAGKRMRTKPAPNDAELLALGREFEAACAKERALCDQLPDADWSDAHAAHDLACDKVEALALEIAETPADGVAGLIVKARAMSSMRRGEPFDDASFGVTANFNADIKLAVSILGDLAALGDQPLPKPVAAEAA